MRYSTISQHSILPGLVLICSLAVGVGCSEGPTASANHSESVEEPISPGQTRQGASSAIPTAGTLGLTFGTGGPAGTIPRSIHVNFDHNIVDGANSRINEDTEVRIEPQIDGRWFFDRRDRLVFRPSTRFEPGESYRVEVRSIGLERGDKEGGQAKLEPSKPWSHEFRMPDFELLDVTTPVSDPRYGIADVDLRFSAPVRLESLREHASWKVEGRPISRVNYEIKDSRHLVHVTLTHSVFDRETGHADVELRLDPGVQMDEDPSILAGAATHEATVRKGERVSISNIVVKEGIDGYFFYVICDDESVGGDQVFFNNLHGYHDYRLSRRCTPDLDSAKRSIHIEPDVDFRIAPASGGFQIRGNFERDQYTVRIESGLRTVDGGLLQKTAERFEQIGPRSSVAEIVGEGRYIPRQAWDNLAIRHRNVDSLNVQIRHVPRENLIFWMSGHNEDANRRTSNLVGETTLELYGKPDEVGSRFIDIGSIVGEQKPGLYEISLSGGGATDTARLLLTDINLLAKRSAASPGSTWSDEVFVWALDMHTGKPKRDVRVKVVRPSGYAMARCRTDSEGACRMQVESDHADDTAPFAVVASDREDVTFLKYEEVKTRIDGADVGGEPYLSDVPYRGAIYGDRDLYRPADEVHVVGILRKNGQESVGRGLPVEFELHDARGRLADTGVLDTNASGMVSIDHQLDDLSPTGRWRLRLLVGEEEVAKHSFYVEEFVPERMRVEVDPHGESFYPEENATFGVHARYLFGATASGSRVELRCRLQPRSYQPPGRAEYKFGAAPFESEDQKTIDLGKVDGQIGDDDTAVLGCPETKITGAVGGKIIANASVFEAGSGRTTDEQGSAWLHPEHFYIGLKASTDEVTANETVDIEGVVVDPQGDAYAGLDEIELEFIQLQRNRTWYFDRARRHHRRRSHWQPIIESTETVEVQDGRFRASVTPSVLRDGFAVRARAEDAATTLQLETTSRSYSSWWWSRRSNQTPHPEDPTKLQLEGPETIGVGTRETVTFNAPFAGRALVTLETHRVVDYEWHDVEAGLNEWSFELTERVPNAYATVLLIKDPHSESKGAFMPERAFGVKSLRVDRSPYRQQLEVEVPDEVRPSSKLEVVVDAGKLREPTFVTVAAVDEGILQLTDYEMPDPLDSLLGKKALGVDTFDTVGWNVQLPAGGQIGPPGGGGGGGGEPSHSGRIMPVEPVALWSGVVQLPESGRKSVTLDIPQYRGELRVMAVAVGAERVGQAETAVKVRDPLAIQTTTPRFLSADDTVEIPVFVTNTTGKEQSVEVSVDAEAIELPGSTVLSSLVDPLSFREDNKSGTIADGESRTFVFKAEAIARSGAARLRVRAKGEGIESLDTKQFPIHSAKPRERLVSTIRVDDGKTKLDKHLRGWVEHSERSSFWVSTVPHPEAFSHLERLVRYPHGCIEQTSSSTRPMVFLSQLMRAVDPESAYSKQQIDTRVRAGLDRILSMQTSQGGFSYWPGGSYPSVWGTTSATHLLLDAKKAGYQVPQARLDDALDWLENSVRDSNHSWASGYTHYVLAQTGRANRGSILRAIHSFDGDVSGWRAEQRLMMKAALYLAGDRRYEDDLREPDLQANSGVTSGWRSYYSDARRRAIALNVYVDLFGHGKEGQSIADKVASDLSHEARRYNTQEMVWGVTGLGKWFKQSGSGIRKAELSVDGKKVPVAADNDFGVSWTLARAADHEDVMLELSSAKKRKTDGDTYLVISSQGVREEPTVEYGGSKLSVRREYLDASGSELDEDEIKLGDVVLVRVTVKNKTGSDLRNIALVDRIPAGWEIENPRHNDRALSQVYSQSQWQTEYMEVRDDRMKYFGTVPSHSYRQVVYPARATLAGEFTAPPIHAESMYKGDVWARERGQSVVVGSPWGDLVD